MAKSPVYADHASTSYPCLFPVPVNEPWANPANSHVLGVRARDAMNDALRRIARAIGSPAADRIVVTANGTEADNLVLQGGAWDYIVTTQAEHHAVLFTTQFLETKRGCEVFYLPLDDTGAIRIADLEAIVMRKSGKIGLVSLMYVNNEVGTVHDLAAVAAALRRLGVAATQPSGRVWLHTDAVQAPGHVVTLDVQALGVDFLCASAHKFHGPTGVGFLYQRDPTRLRPVLFGGHQQGGLRPGTEPVGLVRAMADALEDALARPTRLTALRRLSDAVWDALGPFIVSGLVLPTGASRLGSARAPHHVSFCVRGARRHKLVKAMEERGVLVSGGSACNTESTLPSHVLSALAIPLDYIHGSMRLTFSHVNTWEEVRDRVIPALVAVLNDAHAR